MVMISGRALLAAACAAACALILAGSARAQDAASAKFVNLDGKTIGAVRLTDTPNGVLIGGQLANLPSGGHGFHIHETGQCDVSDGFESAGGHFAPRGQSHGFMDAAGPHAGDLPNQFVSGEGALHLEVFSPAVTLGPGENSLFDADGSAIVIHGNEDDHTSQPSGDAGSRVACAVVERP